MPIEITWQQYWKVAAMPDPIPRRHGGRLFMIAARFDREHDETEAVDAYAAEDVTERAEADQENR